MRDTEFSDEELYHLAGIIHETRMTECYGNWSSCYRTVWPSSFKEFRAQQQAGQSWIDIAMAQARAVAKFMQPPFEGKVKPFQGRKIL